MPYQYPTAGRAQVCEQQPDSEHQVTAGSTNGAGGGGKKLSACSGTYGNRVRNWPQGGKSEKLMLNYRVSQFERRVTSTAQMRKRVSLANQTRRATRQHTQRKTIDTIQEKHPTLLAAFC